MAGEVVYNGAPLSRLGGEALRRIRGNEIAMIFQNPQSALPHARGGRARRRAVSGAPRALQPRCRRGRRGDAVAGAPDPERVADLYPFQPRCNKATSRCRTGDAPALDDIEPGHRVACYNAVAVPLVMQ